MQKGISIQILVIIGTMLISILEFGCHPDDFIVLHGEININVDSVSQTWVALSWNAISGADRYWISVDSLENKIYDDSTGATWNICDSLCPNSTYGVVIGAFPSKGAALISDKILISTLK